MFINRNWNIYLIIGVLLLTVVKITEINNVVLDLSILVLGLIFSAYGLYIYLYKTTIKKSSLFGTSNDKTNKEHE